MRYRQIRFSISQVLSKMFAVRFLPGFLMIVLVTCKLYACVCIYRICVFMGLSNYFMNNVYTCLSSETQHTFCCNWCSFIIQTRVCKEFYLSIDEDKVQRIFYLILLLGVSRQKTTFFHSIWATSFLSRPVHCVFQKMWSGQSDLSTLAGKPKNNY